MNEKFIISCSPHIRGNNSTAVVMRDVLIALLPALLASVWLFGMRALMLTLVCAAFAVGSEYVFQKASGRPITVNDYSAAVTGVILAFNLPSTLPYWMAALGSVIAIVVVKQLFGGLGRNFANPAITARIVLLVSFAGPMTTWAVPKPVSPDFITGATPLGMMASGNVGALPSLSQMFLGIRGGSLGETCSAALLLGLAYLLYRKVITWHIPAAFVGTVAVLTAVLGENPLYHVLSGGLLLGAVFMATDYTTSPFTDKGKLIFGAGCGILTVIIRVFGNYPEGVSFAILLMNILCPHIDNWTRNKALGGNY